MRGLIALLIVLFAPADGAQVARQVRLLEPGETVIGGKVSGVWQLERSPYLIAGDIEVETLTIRPGVQVLVWPGVRIRVRGSLTVNGTQALPVVMTSRFPGTRWDGLVFSDTTGASSLTFCHLDGSANSGIRIQDSSVVLTSCSIFDNDAPEKGGGLHAELSTGDLTLVGCEVRDNTAADGGGGLNVILGGGTLTLDGCLVSGNRVDRPLGFTRVSIGGGVRVVGPGSVVMTNSLIAENLTDSETQSTGFAGESEGAGVHVVDADLTMTRCIVRSNTALSASFITNFYGSARGAGVYFRGSGRQAVLENCLISDNFARSDASIFDNSAGVDNSGGTLRMTNCTVARNRSRIGVFFSARDGEGSCGVLASGRTVIENTIVYENTMSGFYSLWFPPVQNQVVGNVTVSYSDIEKGAAGVGNFDLVPEFAGGGFSYGDLSFGPFSPCVDAGDPNPLFDDAAFPPSQGGVRNDVGMNGGPVAAGWTSWP